MEWRVERGRVFVGFEGMARRVERGRAFVGLEGMAMARRWNGL